MLGIGGTSCHGPQGADEGAPDAVEALRLIGDPVDVVTGAETHFETDFRLPGATVPLSWVRHYDSRRPTLDRGVGCGFRLSLDVELRLDIDGITFVDGRGVEIAFPFPTGDGDEILREAHVLERLSAQRFRIHRPTADVSFEFELGPNAADGVPPTALVARRGRGAMVRVGYGSRRLSSIDLREVGRLAIEREQDGITGVALTSPEGQRKWLVRYAYDAHGRLVEAQNAYGHSIRYEYDPSGRMSRKTDLRGYSFLYDYDGEGRCIRTRGQDGVADFRFEYRPLERLTIVTRGDGGVWRYTYDDQGTILQIVDPYQGLRAFVRDDDGRVVKEIDPNGNESDIYYDPLGLPFAKRDATGHVRRLPADPTAHPLSHFLPDNPAAWEMGKRHQPAASFVGTVADPRVDHRIPEWARGAVGPTPATVLTPPRTVSDVQGLALRQERSDGKTRRWGLDPNGYPRWRTDFDGATTRYEHGSWNHLLRREAPLRRITEYEYTDGERLKSVLDAGGTHSEYRYDLKDRLVEVKRNGKVRERYRYDAGDNLVEKSDGDGKPILQLIIGPGNLVKKRRLASGDVWDLKHDAKGRLVEGSNRAGSYRFEHDADGAVTVDERDGRGVRHTFHRAGVMKTELLGRFATEYLPGDDGVVLIKDPGDQVQRLERLGSGLVERSGSNGVRELCHYDPAGRCLLKAAEGPAWGRPDAKDQVGGAKEIGWARRFSYSAEGDLVRREDSLGGTTIVRHDEAHRLAAVMLPDGSEERYAYDRADNLLQAPGLVAGVRPGNQLVVGNGDGFEYDARDRVACRRSTGGETRYEYDSRDQLVAIDGPGLSYRAQHDVLGRRTTKIVNERTWQYFWDDDRLAGELFPDGRLRVYVYADGAALVPLSFLDYDSVEAAPTSGRRYHVYTDHLGCPELVLDDDGKTVWRARIRAYGTAVVDVGADFHQPLRWPGHYFDAETGLHENRFRSYSPELGRYLQSDPAGIVGGLNLYAYTDNPLRQVDLDGLGKSCPDDVEDCPHRKKDGKDKEETDEGKKPLQDRVGWVDEYGEQKKVTGDGSVDRDHQPSKAAIKKAVDDDIARRVAAGEIDKPTAAQMKAIHDRIDKEALSVVVDHDVHKAGPTHGNKNKEQSEIDKHDLGAAAARDADAMVANTAIHDPDNLPAAQAAADKVKEQTHDSIMAKNRGIVDDVLGSDE